MIDKCLIYVSMFKVKEIRICQNNVSISGTGHDPYFLIIQFNGSLTEQII